MAICRGVTLRRPKKNWDKLEHELKVEEKEEKLDGEAALHKLFRDIYGNADEDTRRAMNKSFQARSPGMVTISPSACLRAGLALQSRAAVRRGARWCSGVCGMCAECGAAEAVRSRAAAVLPQPAGMPCNALKAMRSLWCCLITRSRGWRHSNLKFLAPTTASWKE